MIPKFRAWIKSKQRMEAVASMNWHKDELSRITTRRNGVLTAHLPEDVVHMRSTSLFDKKDVEIFEGDILECENIPNEVKWLETVHWNEEKAQFVSREIEANIQRDTELYSLLSPTFMSIRVIGNIYEDPELVEENV